MSEIFISHVEEDADLALEIALALEEAGYSTWCFETDAIPGQSQLRQTESAIEESKVTVVVISPYSLRGNRVNNEVMRGFETGKHFVPLLRRITHNELVRSRAVCQQAIGDAAWIYVPDYGAAPIIDRIVRGLRDAGFHPGHAPQSERVALLRSALLGWQVRTDSMATDQGRLASAQRKETAPLHPKRAGAVPGEEANSTSVDSAGKPKRKWRLALVLLTALVAVGVIVGGIWLGTSPPTVLFRDDFSDETTGWDTFTDDSGSALYTGGTLQLASHSSDGSSRSFAHKTFTDFAMEVETSFVGDDSSGTYYGICFQLENGRCWDWTIGPHATWLNTKPTEEHPDDFVAGSAYGVILEGTDVTNKIRVEYAYGVVRFSVNGTRLIQYNSDVAVSSIGLAVLCRDGGSVKASFDNVVVISR